MIQGPFEYDPELLEKARWIVEHGQGRPPKHEIDKQLELPLPMPPREQRRGPEKAFNHS